MGSLRKEGAFKDRSSLKEAKSELRKKYLVLRRELPSEQKTAFDAAICRKILASASYRYADTLLVYSPLPNEVDISAVTYDALAKNKKVAFPRCVPGKPLMEFYTVTSTDELVKGAYSILEPREGASLWSKAEKEHCICLLPGVAFDRYGNRIGYGKGYYDRYLCDKQVQMIGVTYELTLAPRLPHGRFDLAVDMIVTEKRMLAVEG